MDRTTYTYADRRRAVELAGQVGPNTAADQLGIGRSTVRNWCMRHRRGDMPEPAWPALPPELAYGAPGIDELRARWMQRGSYEPSDPLTGEQLLERIWPDRTAAA